MQVLLFYPDGKRSSSTENAVDVADGGGPAGIRIPVPGVQQRPPQAAGPPGAAGHAGGPPANGGPDAGAPRAGARQGFDGPPGARPEPQQMQQLPVMRPGMAPPVPLPPVAGGHAHGAAAAAFAAAAEADAPVPAAGAAAPALPPPALRAQHGAGAHAGGPEGNDAGPEPGLPERRAQALNQAQRQAAAEAAVANANAAVHAAHAQAAVHHAAAAAHGQGQHLPPGAQPARRDPTNDYAALFVALIGEGENPQGVVNTSDGRVVRAFHRFTLVDQSGEALVLSLRQLLPSSCHDVVIRFVIRCKKRLISAHRHKLPSSGLHLCLPQANDVKALRSDRLRLLFPQCKVGT